MTTNLPEKPSELIEHALRDLFLCEQDPVYQINMSVWHTYHQVSPMQKVCMVCLGGSVMAKSLNAEAFTVQEPYQKQWEEIVDDRGISASAKIQALDFFRVGDIWSGFDKMDYPESAVEKVMVALFPEAKKYTNAPIISYHEDPKRFKRDLQKMVSAMKKFGY